MPKYYKETLNKASQRYKKKNTEQINISFQSGQGIKEMFRDQADQHQLPERAGDQGDVPGPG